ncbi:hypothetical protein N7474_003979 [Penicillium riverlandense]|uniref:uncharacterized protein n=1 Tax=Penicillium riverlandense TaxID=1903569 RepID=UPI002546D454|nr:uncharacterized protein N7474_003979 [Penicillium riverlandense]KAJ5818388.1 hypothetical protein N7474_003979 [Penicillium riverlandense]
MVSRTPTLSNLPPECVEEIMEYLDLDALKALRLSSRELCIDSTGPRFKKFISCQTMEVTKIALMSFRELAVHPLGAAVKNLKIMATVYDQTLQLKVLNTRENNTTDEVPPLSQAQDDLAWLQSQQQGQDEVSYDEAVDHLAFCLGHFRTLDHIELDAVLVQGPSTIMATDTGQTNWYPVWTRASRIYCMTMEAIASSGVGPKSLTVYQATPRCSVPLYDIAANIEMLYSANLKNAGKCIENVALSISTKVATGATERPPRAPVACHDMPYDKGPFSAASISSLGEDKFLEVEKFDGLARFLEITPNLKTLEIHFYQTLLKPRTQYQLMFNTVANEIRLPLLRQCSLRGITTREDSLLQFLSNHSQITDLTLSQVSLAPEETWGSIFTHLSRKMPHLERLHLSTLRLGNNSMINLHPVWEDHSKELEENSRSGIYFVHTKVFNADDLRKGLEFWPMPVASMQGSQSASLWILSVKKEYGPPWSNREGISMI